MKALVWFIIVVCLIGTAVTLWLHARKQAMRRRESEMRSAAVLAEVMEAMRSKAKTPGPGARD